MLMNQEQPERLVPSLFIKFKGTTDILLRLQHGKKRMTRIALTIVTVSVFR